MRLHAAISTRAVACRQRLCAYSAYFIIAVARWFWYNVNNDFAVRETMRERNGRKVKTGCR